MRRFLVKDLLSGLDSENHITAQQSIEYIGWIGFNIVDITTEFVLENKLLESYFVKGMNRTFRTGYFKELLNKWTLIYLLKLFDMLDYFVKHQSQPDKRLILEDVPINRFGVGKYCARFKTLPDIKWKTQAGLPRRLFSILMRPFSILYISLSKGVKISARREKYKVLRESMWGLYDVRGYYLHDDFLVDGNKIKQDDLLLFSRGKPTELYRVKAYNDAKSSPYAHFDILSLSLDAVCLFSRIIPKYIVSGSRILSGEIFSDNFSLYWSVYSSFLSNFLFY